MRTATVLLCLATLALATSCQDQETTYELGLRDYAPNPVDFGTVLTTVEATAQLVVSNVGPGLLRIESAAITDSDGGRFSTGPTEALPVTLESEESWSLDAHFLSSTGGDFSGVLEVVTHDCGGSQSCGHLATDGIELVAMAVE